MEQEQKRDGGERQGAWRAARSAATVVTLLVLALYYYWFAVADRYAVFLYGHSAPGVDPAQPFDATTSSRYWMTGLVAAGVVLVATVLGSWARGVIAHKRTSTLLLPHWWQVWALAAVPIALGVPVITMTMNEPTLPWPLALSCLAVVLAGLAVALLPMRWAAERPLDLVWLGADGLGLTPPLVLLHAVEYSGASGERMRAYIWAVVTAAMAAGVAWLLAMSVLRRWRRRMWPAASELLLAGLAISYLLLPLAHYLLFTPGEYRYISAAENFFASHPLLQALALGIAGAMAVATSAGRRWLLGRGGAAPERAGRQE